MPRHAGGFLFPAIDVTTSAWNRCIYSAFQGYVASCWLNILVFEALGTLRGITLNGGIQYIVCKGGNHFSSSID